MLGIQQTRPAGPHDPTSFSAAVASASSPLRTTPKSKKPPSNAQKQSPSVTLPKLDSQETHSEASAEVGETWADVSLEKHIEQETGEQGGDQTAEISQEQSRPVIDGVSEVAQQQSTDTTTEQDEREGEGASNEPNVLDGIDDYSRRPSSPLSELSPAPDEDENPTQEEGESGSKEGGEDNVDSSGDSGIKGQSSVVAPLSNTANPGTFTSNAHATANANQSSTFSGHTSLGNAVVAPFNSDFTIDGLAPSSPLAGTSSQQLSHIISTPPTSSPGKSNIDNAHAGPSGLSSTSPSKVSPTKKFSILLELNAELFKVCQAFVGSGYVPQDTPEAQPYSKRLQSNLTWMSAHVDGVVKLATEVPILDPPALAPSAAHIAFPEGLLDRINNLYSQLPMIFAKDIARRNQKRALSSGTGTPIPGARNSATPSLLPPSGIGIKRERPDSSSGYAGRESPSAAKRRDTGDGKAGGPSTPVQPGSAGAMDMRPPTTPSFPNQSQAQMQMQMQMARSGSSMGGAGPMSSGAQGSGSGDGMFPQNTSPGVTMGNSMLGMAGMGGLSPERARQMQLRIQAQSMMYQQQQQQQQQHLAQQQSQQQHQANQQQQSMQQQQQARLQGGNAGMGSPQRQTEASPSPTQQQMMQAQAANRQMSPPGTSAGMSTGMNGADALNSSPQNQGGMSGNLPQVRSNMNGLGGNAGSNMTLNPQMIANMGPGAMATYQVLQSSQHPMTLYLNQQLPGFSQLPMMEQMRRFQLLQQQRQMQQGQRNQQMMANQMMGGQMRPPNANASGSGVSQMQQLGQGGQMGMAPHMQASTSEGGMQFPGTPTSANVPSRTASGMGMSQQMSSMGGMPNMPNMANLNPQQRQLYLMQMQMRGAGAGASGLGTGGAGPGMNPALMNPQMLAAAQERQRLEQQQRMALAQRQGSPLNPAANNGRDQFPPGLRSNPSTGVGIARNSRSPSVSGLSDMTGAATPRIGGRMLPGNMSGSDDFQRALLLQQAQRNAQMQQQQQAQQQQQGFMQGQGQTQGGWPMQQQQSQQLPLSAGAWPQQNPQGFNMAGSPPNSGMQTVDLMGSARQTSEGSMGQHSPTAPSTDFDNMMNW